MPSKYEVLVEHKFAQQARDILGGAGLGGAATHVRRPTRYMPSDVQATGSSPPPAGSTPGNRQRDWRRAIQASTSSAVQGIAAERFS